VPTRRALATFADSKSPTAATADPILKAPGDVLLIAYTRLYFEQKSSVLRLRRPVTNSQLQSGRAPLSDLCDRASSDFAARLLLSGCQYSLRAERNISATGRRTVVIMSTRRRRRRQARAAVRSRVATARDSRGLVPGSDFMDRTLDAREITTYAAVIWRRFCSHASQVSWRLV